MYAKKSLESWLRKPDVIRKNPLLQLRASKLIVNYFDEIAAFTQVRGINGGNKFSRIKENTAHLHDRVGGVRLRSVSVTSCLLYWGFDRAIPPSLDHQVDQHEQRCRPW